MGLRQDQTDNFGNGYECHTEPVEVLVRDEVSKCYKKDLRNAQTDKVHIFPFKFLSQSLFK